MLPSSPKPDKLALVNETIARMVERSPFYRDRLGNIIGTSRDCHDGCIGRLGDTTSWPLRSLDEIQRLPFTTADDIVAHADEMLCIPIHEVARIKTLYTSGTTGGRKRLFFSEADIESTVSYFQYGMSGIVKADDTVAILFPARTDGSVGQLLERSLARIPCRSQCVDPNLPPEKALEKLCAIKPNCIAGPPDTIERLALSDTGQSLKPRSVLASSDKPSPLFRHVIAETWGAEVFEHYGLTESGLGGAVECREHKGMHLRDDGFIWEVVDPVTGFPRPNGVIGELVFTTLTREAMPLLRYKTGDFAKIVEGACPCGDQTQRIDRIMPHSR